MTANNQKTVDKLVGMKLHYEDERIRADERKKVKEILSKKLEKSKLKEKAEFKKIIAQINSPE